MCDLATGIFVASTAIGTYSSYATQKQVNANLDANASLAREQAAAATKAGEDAEAKKRQQTALLQSAQRAKFGAMGALVNEGAPAEVYVDTAYQGEQDALTIRHNAALQSWGYSQQASIYEGQKSSPLMAGATTLATSLASAAVMGAFGGKAPKVPKSGTVLPASTRYDGLLV